MSSKRNNGLVIKEEIKSDNLGETDAGSMDFGDSFMEGKSLPRISQTINGGLIFYCLGFAFITLLVIAGSLFGKEKSEFFSWYFMIMLLGIINMPLTMLLTDRFRDSGWIVSKVIGIAFTGWLVWLLSSIKIATFSRGTCIVACVICAAINLAILLLCELKHRDRYRLLTNTSEVLQHAFLLELVFLFIFILWTYIKAFNPEAFGTTEKLMDFGFMQAMFKSDYMPPEDLWLAGKSLNYYYVGQFMTTYLSKLSGVGVEYGYNLSLMVIAAFAFVLPLSIISSIASESRLVRNNRGKVIYRLFPYLSGTISGIAVTFAGNFHYCMYAGIIPKLRVLLGIDKVAEAADYSFSDFWFPSSTRYIGFDPDVPDKTIHEFPSYSFVLGDLHAHVINIMFVLAVVAVVAGWMLKYRRRCELMQLEGKSVSCGKGKSFLGINISELTDPSIIVIGFFIGLFHTTNYWDFPIYFVVCGAVILFTNCIKYDFKFKSLVVTAIHGIEVLVVSAIVCLPFTLNFKMIASEPCLAENHSELYQLAILWGIPVICVIAFLFKLISELKEKNTFDLKEKKCGGLLYTFRFIGNLEISDMFVLVLGLCAIGLVIIPELIYIKDIYSGAYKRSNTMFKLTYQAYIMFGMAMGYIIPRFILFSKKFLRGFGIVMLLLLNWTVGYFGNAVKGWFGDVSLKIDMGILYEEGSSVPVPGDTLKYIVLFILHLTFWAFAIWAAGYISLSLRKRRFIMILSASVLSAFFISAIVISVRCYEQNERYNGINCAEYLYSKSEEDYYATNWINENIEGRPVMLEANGDSYDTRYNRISVRTGLPTILGWKTHEWLWQSDSSTEYPAELKLREADIEDIYTDFDINYVRALLKRYKVEYIYVGDAEREKFAELNEETLKRLGSIVYESSPREDGQCYTYIIKVDTLTEENIESN